VPGYESSSAISFAGSEMVSGARFVRIRTVYATNATASPRNQVQEARKP
jgi:hypothetical protein